MFSWQYGSLYVVAVLAMAFVVGVALGLVL